MAAKVIVASTTHRKEFRLAGHVFTPTPQRFELSEADWAEFQRRIKAKAPIVFEPVSLKAHKIDKETKRRITELERNVAELEAALSNAHEATAECARLAEARIEELEALLEEATAVEAAPATTQG